MGAEEYSAPVHAGMAGSGLLSVDPEQPIFGNILPRAAFYGFKGSLRTGQIPRFRQCDAKAGIDFIGVDRSLLQSQPVRSAERRVGKECVSTCRSRWWPDHKKKKNTTNRIYRAK